MPRYTRAQIARRECPITLCNSPICFAVRSFADELKVRNNRAISDSDSAPPERTSRASERNARRAGCCARIPEPFARCFARFARSLERRARPMRFTRRIRVRGAQRGARRAWRDSLHPESTPAGPIGHFACPRGTPGGKQLRLDSSLRSHGSYRGPREQKIHLSGCQESGASSPRWPATRHSDRLVDRRRHHAVVRGDH